MPSRSSQREARPAVRSERTPRIPTLPPKPEAPETNRGLINISKFQWSKIQILLHRIQQPIPELQILKVFSYSDCFCFFETKMQDDFKTRSLCNF